MWFVFAVALGGIRIFPYVQSPRIKSSVVEYAILSRQPDA